MQNILDADYQHEKKRKSQKVLWIIIGALLLIVATLLVANHFMQPKSQYELDTEALEGLLNDGLTAEEIQAKLNQVVEEGMFNVSINPTISVGADKKGDVRIENIPNNRYGMQVDIVVTDAKGTKVTVYSSKVLKPGYSIEEGTFTYLPPNGAIDATAVISAIDLKAGKAVGVTNVSVVLFAGSTAE